LFAFNYRLAPYDKQKAIVLIMVGHRPHNQRKGVEARRASSSSQFDCEDTPFAGDALEGLAAAIAEAQAGAGYLIE
jgi:hypothetical protein